MLQFKNLKQVITTFTDEKVCRDFLVQQRWNGSPVCSYCSSNKWYSIEDGKRFKCDKECYKKYSVPVGTCFHASNIPLSTWLPAMYLLTAHKKGISSCQLAKDLGITQKTAWFMLHRMRESLKDKNSFLLKNTVEVDEIYIGGRAKNISNKKRAEAVKINKLTNKTMVIGMIERGGNLRLKVAGHETNKAGISAIIHKNVDTDSILMTDGEPTYVSIGKHFNEHHSVNHAVREYVKDGIKHTNTIEGAFGLFRRSIIGIYHKMSPKHLSRYCSEMEYRYNSRAFKDGDRFESSLGKIETRLSWKELTKDNGYTAQTIIEPDISEIPLVKPTQRKAHEILQYLHGELIARYPSLKEAALATGIKPQAISGVLRNKRRSTGGFNWKYA